MARRYALRDDQWERIKDLVPGRAFPLLSHCRRTIGCSWKLELSEQAICQIKVMQRYQISTDLASFGCLCWRCSARCSWLWCWLWCWLCDRLQELGSIEVS